MPENRSCTFRSKHPNPAALFLHYHVLIPDHRPADQPEPSPKLFCNVIPWRRQFIPPTIVLKQLHPIAVSKYSPSSSTKDEEAHFGGEIQHLDDAQVTPQEVQGGHCVARLAIGPPTIATMPTPANTCSFASFARLGLKSNNFGWLGRISVRCEKIQSIVAEEAFSRKHLDFPDMLERQL